MYMLNNITHINKKTCNTDVSRTRVNLTTPRNIANLTRHSEVSEKVIEKYLTDRAKANGMLCLKYSNPNMTGYPDRLLLLPGGGVVWVELKSKGRKPTKIQQVRHAELSGLGHYVFVIDNKADVDNLINSFEL